MVADILLLGLLEVVRAFRIPRRLDFLSVLLCSLHVPNRCVKVDFD